MAQPSEPKKQRDGPASQVAEKPGTKAMQPTWVDTLARVMERWVPDALTTAIVLMVFLAGLAFAVGGTVTQTVDAFYEGLWMFLRFTMQMTLILVLRGYPKTV
jgi:short-chain fatty acids transporter